MHPDLPELTYLDVATGPIVIKHIDEGGIDLAILDGEATPAGGMGLAKQLKDEIADCPPILVLTGPRRRCLAGQLVARRGRRSTPDRPHRAWRGRGVAAARTRAVTGTKSPAAVHSSRRRAKARRSRQPELDTNQDCGLHSKPR